MTKLCKYLIVLITVFSGASVFPMHAQVNASLQARDSIDLSLIRVYPDSFPDVALFFKAQTRSGRPMWRLPQDKVSVMEDGEERPVISLRPVSEYTPIQIALVIDHSSSMLDEFIYLFDTLEDGSMTLKNIALRKKGEPLAIDRAKKGVIDFVKSLRNERDSFLVVGFSELVDPVKPMTHDTSSILQAVRQMEAGGNTAFYDAVRTGLDSLEHYHGLRAVVALTDGMDNSSHTTIDSLIRRASYSEIPVYVIGLGNVDKGVLQKLADRTAGEFFYTDQAHSLSEIYLRISSRLQAIYELVYRSHTLRSSAETHREVQIVFDIDSVYFGQPLEKFDLPLSAINAMKARERRTQLYLAGGMALIALVAIGFLLLSRRRKEEEEPLLSDPPQLPETLSIPRAFPNPSAGHVYFSMELPATTQSAELSITNMSGMLVRTFTISGAHPMLELDLSDLPGGTYLYRLSSQKSVSKAGKLVIQK